MALSACVCRRGCSGFWIFPFKPTVLSRFKFLLTPTSCPVTAYPALNLKCSFKGSSQPQSPGQPQPQCPHFQACDQSPLDARAGASAQAQGCSEEPHLGVP